MKSSFFKLARSLPLVLVVLTVLTVQSADAFKPYGQGHPAIADEALRDPRLDVDWFDDHLLQFTDQSIEEIRLWVKEPDALEYTDPAPHFTDEVFVAGSERLHAQRTKILALIQQEVPEGAIARAILGAALHAVQDFYAHSTWVNLNPNSLSGDISGAKKWAELPDEQVCLDDGVTVIPNRRLTSGYFLGTSQVCSYPEKKCRHGDDFLCPGIGKDTDANPGYASARQLAKNASVAFVKSIIDEVHDNARAIAALMGIRSVAFVLDHTYSMHDKLAEQKQKIATEVADLKNSSYPPSRYFLIPFGDPDTGALMRFEDADEFIAALGGVQTPSEPDEANEDCPEYAFNGLLLAVNASQPGGDVYLFTDASAKDGEMQSYVSEKVNKKQLRTFQKLSGLCSPLDPAYIDLANETSGDLYLSLSPSDYSRSASMIAENFDTTALIKYVTGEVSGSVTIEVPVDSTVTKLNVSTSIWHQKDADVYQFEGVANQAIIAEVRAKRIGSSLDSVLTLLDSDGETTLAHSDDDFDLPYNVHTDSRILNFSLPHTGTFYLRVTDYGGDSHIRSGPNFYYELSLRTVGGSESDGGSEVELNDWTSAATSIEIGTFLHGVADPPPVAISLVRPSGAVVAETDTDAQVTALTAGNSIVVEEPTPGLWQLSLTGAGSFTASASAASPLRFLDYSYVASAGAPGHEALWPLEGQPVVGSSQIARARMTGPYESAEFQFLRDTGETIASPSLTAGNYGQLNDEHLGSVVVPVEPYRVAARGVDESGFEFERVFRSQQGKHLIRVFRKSGPDVLPIGQTTTLTFTIQNSEANPRSFYLDPRDNEGFVSRIEPELVEVPSGGSADVEVDFDVPEDAEPGKSNPLYTYVLPAAPTNYFADASTYEVLKIAQCPESCAPLDQCHVAGTCDAVTQICSQPSAADGTSCDDANPCTIGDTCQAGACTSGTRKDCSTLTSACGQGVCDEVDGACILATYPNDWCDDGVFCNGSDQCSNGLCNTHAGTPCSGGQICHEEAKVCGNPDGSPCDDGVFCNGSDTYLDGECSEHSGDPCAGEDGDGDCAESCDEDANSCTAPDVDGTDCNDGFFCNGADTCNDGECDAHSGNPCPGADGDGNCAESCNELDDNCAADDVDGSSCNDGVFCNGTDTCDAGTCSQHVGDPCAGAADCSDSCNESTDDCFAAAETPCDGDGNPCTVDECDGLGICAHQAGNAGTVCRNSGGVCDPEESCTGTAVNCPADVFKDSQTVCRASSGICDISERCSGDSVTCPADTFVDTTTVCRDSSGVCDVSENCTGSDASCPSDSLLGTTTACRSSIGLCDVPENCTGSDTDCPVDAFAASTTPCRAMAGICDVTENCTGTNSACPADAVSPTTAVCRPAAGICDLVERCDGSHVVCPADGKNTVECRSSAGVCDIAEVCDGANDACPSDTKSTSECRPSAGVCDVAETCDGFINACPMDSKGTAVCRSSVGVCDAAESCDGINDMCPADAKSSAVCRASVGFCDLVEICDGTSDSCPADSRSTATCRAATDVCDIAELCDGTNADCPAEGYASSSTSCRASAGICDPSENCTGTSPSCPGNAFAPTTDVCRSAAGVCDVPESCTGTTAACPANFIHNTSKVCRAAGGVCDVAENCTGTSISCPSDSFVASTTTCRASADVCDVAEKCTGTSAGCPANSFVSSTTICRTTAGICDVAENCTGTTQSCPSDVLLTSTTTCRAAAGVCDVLERCSGTAVACPSDAFASSTTSCRAAAGVCDVAENCTGTTAACPSNSFVASTTACRTAAGVCDITENCTGTAASCPANTLSPTSTVCRSSSGICDVQENCTGNSSSCPADSVMSSQTTCRASAGVCDIAEKCSGTSKTCASDSFVAANTACTDDANPCTTDACSGSAAACGHVDTCAPCTTITIPDNGYYALTANYETTGTCLRVFGENATLDLNGHFVFNLYDPESEAIFLTGIYCNSPGMRITDSVGTGYIGGNFDFGLLNCAVVDHLVVEPDVLTGVINVGQGLRSLSDSSISAQDAAVYADLESNASKIINNALTGGVGLNNMAFRMGTGGARISDNVVSGGIFVEDGVLANVERNLITDHAGSSCTGFGTDTTYRRLYCDCAECSGANPAFDFPDEGTFGACPGQLSSGSFVNGVYTLTTDLDLASTSGNCIKVVDANKIIELNGHTIYNSLSGGTGILFASGGGGTVRDTASVRGGISGGFNVGIQDAQHITGVQIRGPVTGVSNPTSSNADALALDDLTNSVIEVSQTAVSSVLLRRTSHIDGNFLGAGSKGIDILNNRLYGGGTAKAQINDNVIRESSVYAVRTAANNASYANVHDVLMYRRNDAVTGYCLDLTLGTVDSRLMCNCESSEGCEGFDAPMTFPLF